MRNKNSITELNTIITNLSDFIQKSRTILSTDNNDANLSSDETRRIVLVCLLLMHTGKRYDGSNTVHLLDALSELHLADGCIFNLCDKTLHHIDITGTLLSLTPVLQYPNSQSLLNYALESLEYDVNEYFNTKVSRGTRNSNIKKKGHGIYYTPIDVVDFMVSKCIASIFRITSRPTVLDCSCGSGVFLLQSFTYLEKNNNPYHSLDMSLNLLEKCIWGIDISPAAVDCCKTAFILYYLTCYEKAIDRIKDIWYALDRSIFVGDSTQFKKIQSLHNELPLSFNCIVGNPPYVSMGRNTNLYIPFVENMIEFSSVDSCSALVLPLSICYSRGERYTSLREHIRFDNATWTFLNYDRSPDSLFGDQVKTRNTILFRNTLERKAKMLTTKLQRWTSSERNLLFSGYELCNISELQILSCVPKISNDLEKIAFTSICYGDNCLRELCIPYRSDYSLVVNGTAYNWICVYDHIPSSIDEHGNSYLSNTAKTYYFPNEASRDFCIALLSNRIAYWYWVASGDGFHLTASFLLDYHIGWNCFTESQQEELCWLGKEYSRRVKESPTISFNAGKRIVNYSHWGAMDIVQRIEKNIIDALNLPENFSSHIDNWYYTQVYCNRDNEKR